MLCGGHNIARIRVISRGGYGNIIFLRQGGENQGRGDWIPLCDISNCVLSQWGRKGLGMITWGVWFFQWGLCEVVFSRGEGEGFGIAGCGGMIGNLGLFLGQGGVVGYVLRIQILGGGKVIQIVIINIHWHILNIQGGFGGRGHFD